MTEEPLIYTSKGNLPMASLQYRCGWQQTDSATVFWEEYWQGDELVKRSAHALSKFGIEGEGLAADLGS